MLQIKKCFIIRGIKSCLEKEVQSYVFLLQMWPIVQIEGAP